MQCLYLQNNTHTLWNNSCSFSRDLVYGTRWTNPLSANLFPSLMMLRSYGPQRFWVTNSTFLCDHQKSIEQTQRDVLRDKLEPKLVNVTNKIESYKMDWRILHFNKNFTFWNVYLIYGKQRLEWLWVFQPWFGKNKTVIGMF